MKTLKILLTLALIVGGTLITGCAANTVAAGEESTASSVVIQYSGGKEIGKWYLRERPSLDHGCVTIRSGDTLIRACGDIRIISVSK